MADWAHTEHRYVEAVHVTQTQYAEKV